MDQYFSRTRRRFGKRGEAGGTSPFFHLPSPLPAPGSPGMTDSTPTAPSPRITDPGHESHHGNDLYPRNIWPRFRVDNKPFPPFSLLFSSPLTSQGTILALFSQIWELGSSTNSDSRADPGVFGFFLLQRIEGFAGGGGGGGKFFSQMGFAVWSARLGAWNVFQPYLPVLKISWQCCQEEEKRGRTASMFFLPLGEAQEVIGYFGGDLGKIISFYTFQFLLSSQGYFIFLVPLGICLFVYLFIY